MPDAAAVGGTSPGVVGAFLRLLMLLVAWRLGLFDPATRAPDNAQVPDTVTDSAGRNDNVPPDGAGRDVAGYPS